MQMRKIAVAVAAAVSLSQISGAAFAQTKVYVIDEAKIRRESKIGKDISAKLGESQKAGVDKLGLQALAQEVQTAEAALAPQVQNLTPEALKANAALKAKVDELAKKQAELVQKSRYLDANMDQAENATMIAFASALAPAVDHVGKQVGADVVLSTSATWYIKDAVDISGKVIQRLDATTPSLDSLKVAAAANQPAPKAP